MWWTQPKLALIAVGLNAVLIAAASLLVGDAGRRVAFVAASQIVLLIWYWRASLRLGSQHLALETVRAFDRNLWDKEWKASVDRTFMSPDQMPRADGGSFYQQILGDTPGIGDSLYRALALWEGMRLQWPGSLAGVAVAFAAGLLPLLWWPPNLVPAMRFVAAALLPLWVVVAPEPVNVLMLRRRILRGGIVERVAFLIPRTAEDIGLAHDWGEPETSWGEAITVYGVALGVPLVILVSLASGVRGLALVGVLGTGIAVAVYAAVSGYRRLLVSGIPFLRLTASDEVNLLLDLMHRQRAFVVLQLMPAVMFSLMFLVEPSRYPLHAIFVAGAIAYVAAVIFGDQLSAYAGFYSATRFEEVFRRSMSKMRAATA